MKKPDPRATFEALALFAAIVHAYGGQARTIKLEAFAAALKAAAGQPYALLRTARALVRTHCPAAQADAFDAFCAQMQFELTTTPP